MEKVTFSNITVDRCTQCKGIWFDGVEHKELKRMKGAEAIDVGSDLVGKEYDTVAVVLCPVCRDPMKREPDKFQPHIHYEVCLQGHGAFFDAGEFKDFKTEDFGDFVKSLAWLVKKKK